MSQTCPLQEIHCSNYFDAFSSSFIPKQKEELQSARESVLFPKFIEFEGHELVDSGRFEYEVAIKARALNAGEQKAPAPKAPRLRRKKGEEIKEGAGGREFCAMAIKLNCGGQCWATISEGVKRWSRADKFCKKCNVFLIRHATTGIMNSMGETLSLLGILNSRQTKWHVRTPANS